MRMGVLDVGSNTLHLLLVDAHRGAHPLPAYTHKAELRLAELLNQDGEIAADGVAEIIRFCKEAIDIAEDKGAESMLAFATSALREARNSEAVLDEIQEATGLGLDVLSGEDEARLTFLAVRRWYGWSSGRLLCFDIGGGSLEIAGGVDEEPDVAISLPLGAGRLTRSWFTDDPPHEDELRKMRKHVRASVAAIVGNVMRFGPPDRVVATSKTFRSLARVAGAAPSSEGPFVPRALERRAVAKLVGKLAGMSSSDRAKLHGVSPGRSTQLLAGAVVADAAMDLFEVESVQICPWALREGVILRRLDHLAGV